ncbi:MAG: glycosyltransferase [Bacteroidales bacterium]|jgi:rhamnosyltransferase|nr:glycosyltransferase [Bacteroidales bacterium]
MPQITILLATFNGEKYVEQQIESIIKQSFKDWNLIIHDDGSTDNTLSIIRKWQEIDTRIKIIEDKIVFCSSAANFMHLLTFATSDFVMFCDQDDVWLENKLQVMYDVIITKNNALPQVVYANAEIWNADGTFNGKIPFWEPKHLRDTLFLNGGIHGCVSIFNSKILTLMLEQKHTPAMHDHLLLLVGLAFGEVTYMDDVVLWFRRHPQAVTNGTEIKKSRLASLLNCANFPVIDCKHYIGVLHFYQDYNKLFNDSQRTLIECYLSLPKMNLLCRLLKIIRYKFTHGGSRIELLAKILTRKFID